MIDTSIGQSASTRTGREYLRVSLDRSGRARSVDEQHTENVSAAGSRNIILGKPYTDNSVSASRYTTKIREGFDDLLDDLRNGRFGADELWLWESSRGSRRVGEWVELIDALESAHVLVHVTTHGRTYDAANGRDRRSLLEDAVDSEYESSKTSARARRASASGAAAGKPHGRVPFGYRRLYDPQTRKLVAQEPHPDEAMIVRELYNRLVKGQSLISIAKDFDARGVRNDRGTAFSAQHLRSIALSPTYAGLRVHDPEARKSNTRSLREGKGTWVQGTWDALVERDTWETVYAMLTDPARVTTRPGGARHLLSMIARCDECDGPLVVTNRRALPEYQCQKSGCVRVRKDDLDTLAEEAIIRALSEPHNHEGIDRSQKDDEALENIRRQLADARAELDALYSRVGSGAVSVAALAKVEPVMVSRIQGLERDERELTAPSALRGLITPGASVRRQWNGADIMTRRAIARAVLAPGLGGTLRVRRRPVGSRNVHVNVRDRVSFRDAGRESP